ncbi:MAG: hypothetical protein ACM3WU_11860 [Bacillota bacterium]
MALYDLEAKKQVWVSELQIPENVTPTWSPNGDMLAYVSKDLAASKSYLVLLDVASRTERLVEVKEFAYKWSFDHGAKIKWAPVPRFISIHEHAAPPSYTTVVDLDSEKTLVRYRNDDFPLWSPDCRKAAYVQIEGRYDVGPEGPEFVCKLLILDTDSGESSLMVEGDRGYIIRAVEWTEDGAVVYRYVQLDGPDRRMLDTQGREYEFPEIPPAKPGSAVPTPPGFPEGLGSLTAAELNPDTGEWLVAVAAKTGPTRVFRYKEGESPVQVVQGERPSWRPSGVSSNQKR